MLHMVPRQRLLRKASRQWKPWEATRVPPRMPFAWWGILWVEPWSSVHFHQFFLADHWKRTGVFKTFCVPAFNPSQVVKGLVGSGQPAQAQELAKEELAKFREAKSNRKTKIPTVPPESTKRSSYSTVTETSQPLSKIPVCEQRKVLYAKGIFFANLIWFYTIASCVTMTKSPDLTETFHLFLNIKSLCQVPWWLGVGCKIDILLNWYSTLEA